MLTFAASQRIYLAVEPVDMRKQFNGLWAQAVEKLREDPFAGSLFVFTNKARNRLKIMFWDGSGVWVLAKRLEKGRFTWPLGREGAKLNLEPAALTMLLARIDLKDGCKKRGTSDERAGHNVYLPYAYTMSPAEALLQEVRAELAVVRAENAWLKRQLFGPGKSEKLDRLQGALPLEGVVEQPVPAKVTAVSYERLAAPREKRPVPAEAFKDVPVKETIVLEPEEVKQDPAAYEQIGEERTFEVDIVPPQVFKREIVRPKYRHRTDRERPPVVAPAPLRPVMGGYASAGLLAWIALSKYVDHQPLHRLEKQSARWGATIPRQTMVDWIRITAEWLEPIYRQMLKRLLAGGYLQADETPVRCNDPDEKRGGTTEGWLWVISRPGEDVVFDWRLSRRHGELTSLIQGFGGILQSDMYAAYESYAANHPEITWVGCWAHARRKFFEAERENPKAVHLILKLIGWLYECEARWDEHQLTVSNRQRHRQTHYPRKLYWLKKITLGLRQRTLPKSGLGKACDYLLKYWAPLIRHLEHGETRIDNNLVENAIRSSAIGKKNWLFVGHPDAGQRSAIIYSIVVSCQRRGIEPLAYLRDVLQRLPRMTTKDDLDTLTPAHWQPAS